jgi:hypothetical protein
LLAGAQFVEGVEQVRPHFGWRHLSCRASSGEKEAHIMLILLSVGRWFFGFEFDKKILGAGLRVLAVLRVFLRGVLGNRAFF